MFTYIAHCILSSKKHLRAYSYAPLADDEVCRRMGWQTPPDRLTRLRSFCYTYGLGRAERRRLPGLIVRLARQQIADIERTAQEGIERARFLVEVVGYPRLVSWRIRWIRDHREELLRALCEMQDAALIP